MMTRCAFVVMLKHSETTHEVMDYLRNPEKAPL